MRDEVCPVPIGERLARVCAVENRSHAKRTFHSQEVTCVRHVVKAPVRYGDLLVRHRDAVRTATVKLPHDGLEVRRNERDERAATVEERVHVGCDRRVHSRVATEDVRVDEFAQVPAIADDVDALTRTVRQ